MKDARILEWDTDFFGHKVAKIIPSRLSSSALQSLLAMLKAEGIKLVYWAAESNDLAVHQAAEDCHGFLADQKLTYLIPLATLSLPTQLPPHIEYYNEVLPSSALEALALESGLYSRFRTDPAIGTARFEQIYKAWIRNATNKTLAEHVLVIRDRNTIVAMATLGKKENRGDIGLLAVAPLFRGRGLGKLIVQAALTQFKRDGYLESQVVTQAANVNACQLYERCGYQREKLEYFYHFWL